LDVDSFTDAVFKAEEMGDMSYTDIRRRYERSSISTWAYG